MKTNDEALIKIKYDVLRTAGFRGQTRGRERQYPVQTDPGPEGTVPLLCIQGERDHPSENPSRGGKMSE
mgnify:CR=1 FL=1